MLDGEDIEPEEIAGAAHDLLLAERTRNAIEPLSQTLPGLQIDDAYAIQTHGRALRLQDGARLVGHKIGLTSKPMQAMVGVDEPDYGYLLDARVLRSGDHVAAAGLIAPRVEAEIAFRLRTTIAGPAVSVDEVLAATEGVSVALEVIDSRIVDWRIAITDTIADNASSACAVIGDWLALGDLDLPSLTMTMDVAGSVVEGRGAAVLGHPALAVAWLARALHAQGEALEAGEIVLSGALAKALPIQAGGHARAVIDGLGSVRATF